MATMINLLHFHFVNLLLTEYHEPTITTIATIATITDSGLGGDYLTQELMTYHKHTNTQKDKHTNLQIREYKDIHKCGP